MSPGAVVVVTGGTRGGLGLARAFRARGCRVALCGRRGAEVPPGPPDRVLVRRSRDVLPATVTER